VTNPSWGTKRNCPSCNAHFYDLNKVPAACPKCKHQFDPAILVRARRKAAKREAPKENKAEVTATILAAKKVSIPKKKDKKQLEAEAEGAGEGIGDIAEIEDVDDIENLQELSELEEMEESSANEDDTDDETIIEDLNTDGKAIVGNVEEEEAKALGKEIEEEDVESLPKKNKPKTIVKPKKR
jgi:uncharacterized protein (TIGR02300 family)